MFWNVIFSIVLFKMPIMKFLIKKWLVKELRDMATMVVIIKPDKGSVLRV